MTENITTQIRDRFLQRYTGTIWEKAIATRLEPQTFFEQTNLENICRLYSKTEDGREQLTFEVDDILNLTERLAYRYADLSLIKNYLALFTENGSIYNLKQRFTDAKIPYEFKYITFNIADAIRYQPYQPQDLENAVTLLAQPQTIDLLVSYKGRQGQSNTFYQSIVGAAIKNPESAQKLLACFNDPRIHTLLMSETMTFTYTQFRKMGYNNQENFRDLVYSTIDETCDPGAVLTLTEKTKNEWLIILKLE